MDLPTYTNIWRIEKRLYKLYDLRLPMPLPIVWIGIFVGVLAPWSFLLWLVGLPFDAPWHVVYLVPPGVVTWLSTRPVIENKRLTELLQSQLRYMGEPRAWCRMAPTAEPETVAFAGRVWRALPARAKLKEQRRPRHSKREQALEPSPARTVRPAVAAAAAAATHAPVAEAPPTRWGAVATPRRGTAPSLATAPQLPARSTPDPAPPAQEAPAPPIPVVAPEAPVVAPKAHMAEDLTSPAAEAAQAAMGEMPAAVPGEPAKVAPPNAVEAVPHEAVEAAPRDVAEVVPHEAVEAVPHDVAEAASHAAVEAVPREAAEAVPQDGVEAARREEKAPAAGKPIDTEALRRLRRLAASADEQPESAPEVPAPSGKQEQAADDARVQHRKGQPPRQGAPLTLSGGQQVWPPMNPDAKPVPSVRAGSPAPARDADRPARQEPAQPDRPARQEQPGTADEPPAAGQQPAAARQAPEVGRPAPKRAAGSPATPVPGPRPGEREGRVRRVESVVGRDSGGWRRIAQVVVGGSGVRTDGSEIDEARARAVFSGSRRVVVLGCTGGAGQSTTALMLGHTLARFRDDRVLAVDANTGPNTLTSRIKAESPETLTSLLSGLDQVSGYLTMRGYTSRTTSGLEVIGADTDAGAEQRLADRTLFSDQRLGQAVRLLDRHYKLAVIDPAAALAARVLPYADQLVLVVPASEEAPDAVAMTFEWLDGHGCADLRRRAVTVVNGVSRRSMADVEQAESVARGRCRAIVRVPWEDDLAPGGADVVEPGQLRAAGRRAYLALAGVVVAGFAAQSVRASEEELASDPPGTRIGER